MCQKKKRSFDSFCKRLYSKVYFTTKLSPSYLLGAKNSYSASAGISKKCVWQFLWFFRNFRTGQNPYLPREEPGAPSTRGTSPRAEEAQKTCTRLCLAVGWASRRR